MARLSEWKERIVECRNSGHTVQAWCEQNGINPKTYYRWEESSYQWPRDEAEVQKITFQEYHRLLEGLQVKRRRVHALKEWG